jgi:hypothetical protein
MYTEQGSHPAGVLGSQKHSASLIALPSLSTTFKMAPLIHRKHFHKLLASPTHLSSQQVAFTHKIHKILTTILDEYGALVIR